MVAGLDEHLLGSALRRNRPVWRLWEPRRVRVVLGRSSPMERELHLSRCAADRVPIQRRFGGGCSVVLAPGMVIFSLAYVVRWTDRSMAHLHQWTRLIAEALREHGVNDLSVQGVSDVCVGDRKIMGSCLYRTRQLCLYQASLLVSCDLDVLERYLALPVRMPAYRRGRAHREFLTTLERQGCVWTCGDVMGMINRAMALAWTPSGQHDPALAPDAALANA